GVLLFFFFFQAEDGIRDKLVTGVQTCALPISPWLAVCVLAGSLGAPSAPAWGCKGHQTVASIAEKHLTPEARQMVQKLLGDNPMDPKLRRWCGNATTDLIVDASTWPDDVRNERK